MNKRTTSYKRAATVAKIRQQLLDLSREDLLEIQRSIEDLLPTAIPAPTGLENGEKADNGQSWITLGEGGNDENHYS